MQSNRLALVAPLSVLLAAGGAINFACSNSDDDNNNGQADSGVYIDGGIQEGVPPGSGYTPPAGGDDDDDDGSTTPPTGDSGTTPPTDGGGDTGTTPPTDAGDSGGGGTTAPTTLAVLRLGDGTTALPGVETTAASFIDFYKIADGTSGGTSVSFGTTFSVSYNGLAGALALSTNGSYLVVGGYNTTPGTANSATLKRSIARVSAGGTIDSTTIVGAFTGATDAYIRGVASIDGSGFWVTGSGTPDGTVYVPFGDTGTGAVQIEQATPNPATTRDVGIFDGQLFISAQTETAPTFTGVGTLGTGTPKTGPNTPTELTNDGPGLTPSPTAFVAFDTDTTAGVDTIYVADTTSGLHKWKLGTTTFAEVGSAVIATGVRGVTGFVSGTNISLFATSADGTVIQSVTDTTTSTTNGTVGATPFATAGAKKTFRGIAFAAQ